VRFKNYYLQEKLNHIEVGELKNIISGVAEKEIPNEVKVDKGYTFKISNLGAWSTFKKNLIQTLSEKKFKDYSTEANSLHLKNKDSALFVEYTNGNVDFFVTDDLEYIPGEENEV
jgi:hypothetical protein